MEFSIVADKVPTRCIHMCIGGTESGLTGPV
ncbi:ACT domain-containing protein ACR12 [Zea mays]|uniref:ACT domain-containing protein ACR12 n=1 Tax=Zea mays TaxID=4577 RepID=A0A1D6NQX2_MAIZE|nr:ACT domain-containing protein ACR12 [Zea mays]